MSADPARPEDTQVRELMANIAARWAMPMMLGLGGWFVARAIDRYSVEQNEYRAMAERNTAKLLSIESDVRDLNTRFNTLVIRRIDDHEKSIERIEIRIQSIEQSQKRAP